MYAFLLLALAQHDGETFTGTTVTQSISILNDRDRIVQVDRSLLEKKWQVPGGMEGLTGWKVEKRKHLPADPAQWIGNISVKNSLGYYQQNRGLLRSYADGTRFDEVLTNAESGKVFEHRVAIKEKGSWRRYVESSDANERPAGYVGLKVTCASCHSQAGTGEYGIGLVPGGDTVMSDPLPWELVGYSKPAYRWQRFADGDKSQVALMLGDVQVGVYSFADKAYNRLEGGKWANKSDPPIMPPK